MSANRTPDLDETQPGCVDVECELVAPDLAEDEADERTGAATERELDPDVEQIVEDFVEVGKMWAHHGVTIGKMALESSARTYQVTASALDLIARRLAPRRRSEA